MKGFSEELEGRTFAFRGGGDRYGDPYSHAVIFNVPDRIIVRIILGTVARFLRWLFPVIEGRLVAFSSKSPTAASVRLAGRLAAQEGFLVNWRREKGSPYFMRPVGMGHWKKELENG